jgi:hypothetical protein
VSDKINLNDLKFLGENYLYDDENIYTIFPPEYGYPNVLKI